ncbi:MAG TPA: DEAD/DEAH box helicase [Steroidobacteraceae bacterium]|nr:DEAD/DEAH box helicase [Steroidobacteraceae bacterium]
MNALDSFHPAVAAWFARTFDAPTPAQEQAWPVLQEGRHVLVAAPTGSGKTFAAFLAAIDKLVKEGLQGPLPDETRIVYVSPLKALSNDIRRNLEAPLEGIREELAARRLPDVAIRAVVRTGDTSQAERAGMRRKAPHIVVTTPESLYILLGSQSGRDMLGTCRTVIVDEIHAIAGNKRGAHLALSLERLQALTGRALTRIGLSATQKPIEEVAKFLVGGSSSYGVPGPDGACAPQPARCAIIDSGHARRRDLELELPPAPLEAVMSGEVWTQIYDRLAELVRDHRTTLVFVNTRRLTERVARQLSERLGEENVAAHHGSLSKERRHHAEQRLKRGELQVLVATASLELGIDIGDVDLVCQIGSTRSINAFLQRVGRAGHSVGGISKGRLFPLSRDELVECAALLDAVRRGELDSLRIPENALDVLAQQITAEVAAREWSEDALFDVLRGAHPYRNLQREEFDECVRMLAEGFSTRRGRRGALLHHDAVNKMLRPRKGARLTALTSGGAIPDNADYKVMLEPESHLVGTVNEDFAVESLQGDVFQLGNTSYRILRVERGTVRVEDAHGQPPSIPFWLGEAPGRTLELSAAVSRFRQEIERRLEREAPVTAIPAAGVAALAPGREPAGDTVGEPAGAAGAWLMETVGLAHAAAVQLVQYLAAGRAALGCLPSFDTVIFERFFDESGGMQLVIHSPFGSRVNRAWGLSLRKRFCRTFNFELQAAATEDHIVLSLTHAHSFELAEAARYLNSNSVRQVLVQALCAAPMFEVRWRWDAGIALALPRFRGGKKVPPQIARMNAEDLLASVFPDQVACAENLPGEIEIPDHPLVRQTIRDCLEDAMDIERFEDVLRGLESGAIRVVARDLTEPSPLALEALNARPYAYLDDAPLEERRTQAVMSRRWLDPAAAADIGKLDAQAIARVRTEAWPDATTPDELHDALLSLTFLTEDERRSNPAWPPLMEVLAAAGRVAQLRMQPAHGHAPGHAPGDAPGEAPVAESGAAGRALLWVATERRALFESMPLPEQSLIEIVRGRLEGLGPITASAIADSLTVPVSSINIALAALEAEGFAMRGRFEVKAAVGAGRAGGTDGGGGLHPAEEQWCERRLLARIHRYTVKRLRAEIEPVPAREFLRFLCEWQRTAPDSRMQGSDALTSVLTQLEGFEAPAGSWETEILPSRMTEYDPQWLDEHCRSGRFIWTRLTARDTAAQADPDRSRGASPVRATPIVLLARRNVALWSALSGGSDPAGGLTSRARAVADFIRQHGASFFDEIAEHVGMLPVEVEDALAELVAVGMVNSDSFAGLRVLLMPSGRRSPSSYAVRRKRRLALFGMADAGRWALVRRPASSAAKPADDAVEQIVRTLLRRWGVIFWKLLGRESGGLPPWREILACCRRLEARGEIRGGRFVAGFSGEQYATPEAVGLLRDMRRKPHSGQYVSLSAADPLNLIGILTPGARLASLAGNRLLYRDGLPIAAYAGGEVQYLEETPESKRWAVQSALQRRHASPALDEPV